MRKKSVRFSLIANLVFVAFVIVYTLFSSPEVGMIRLNPLKVLDNAVFDYNMKENMSHAPHEDIFVVAIDDETVEALGRFPFNREYYIPFLEAVRPAKAVAFDIHFVSQSEDAFIDEMLAGQLATMDNVILAASVDLENRLERAVVVDKDSLVTGRLIPPLQVLADEAHLAHINRYAERGYDDGIIRRAWLMLGTEQDPIPALAYRTAELAGVELEEYIHDNPQAEMIIKYDASSYDFQTLSYLDVISGIYPPELFEDRIVLVGVTGLGQDTGNTSVENNVNLVYAHAAIIDQLLKGEQLHAADFWVTALLMVLAFALAIFLVWLLKPIASVLSVIGIGLAMFAGQFYIFANLNVYVNTVYPIAVLLSAFILNIAVKTYFEQKQKSFITKQFGRYISPELVKQIAHSDQELPLGGINKELSILFLDIRGFTSLSEKLTPQEVVDFLNTMFDLITEKALSNQGTIDKFIGDAAMIIFNAPLDVDDHPYYAVKTAYEIQQGMEGVRNRILEKHGVSVNIGIGVNTGEVVVGNIGSYLRVDYTAIGDNVNIAARIESNTEGGQILVSESTYERTKESFIYHCIGERMMKGKTVPVKLYEVQGIHLDEKGSKAEK